MPSRKKKRHVLFLCVSNTCRSQMAEAFLRAAAPEYAEAVSAGSSPGTEVHPLAVRVLREDHGIDLSRHQPKHMRAFLASPVDIVVTTCDAARETCPVFPGAPEMLHWSFEDPAAAEGTEEERLAVFRHVAGQIRAKVKALAALLREKRENF